MSKRKAIFDAVRRMIGRGFARGEVETLDGLLDGFEGRTMPDTPSEPETPHVPQLVGVQGRDIIKRFEGCARLRPDGLVEAYPDPGSSLARTGSGRGDPWTIGWGATGQDHFNGGLIGPGTVWTQEQCDTRLNRDLVKYAREVAIALNGVPTSQAQFDALVSFHYNTGAIGRATLTRKHKAGDFTGAAAEFKRWNKAAGRVLKGLTRRRAEEAALYRGGS